jgi:hypothetical protein
MALLVVVTAVVVVAAALVVLTAVVFAAYTICLQCPPCLHFRRDCVVA